jgi:hypothetical protein
MEFILAGFVVHPQGHQLVEFINDRLIVFRRLVIENELRQINHLTGSDGAYREGFFSGKQPCFYAHQALPLF